MKGITVNEDEAKDEAVQAYLKTISADEEQHPCDIAPKTDKLKLLGRYHSLPRRVEDDYTIADTVLGSGFSGDVRLAFAKGQSKDSGGRQFAVKSLEMLHATQAVWAKMQCELEVSLCVDHPHIVRLINVYEAEDSFFLIMEFLEGGRLSDRMIEGKGLKEDNVANISKQLLLAVSYLHSQGIVHRDLKPDNFVYQTKSGTLLKAIDFGFSKFRLDDDMLLSKCGSPAYAAPEIFSGKGYTGQCDLWSLGVIIFTLLVGYLPSAGSGCKDKDKVDRIKAAVSGMSAGAKDFTRGLMTRDPSTRLTAHGALRHSWLREHGEHCPDSKEVVVDDGIMTSLQSYCRAPKLQRLFLSAIAKTISDDNAKFTKYREQFLNINDGSSGAISGSEVETSMLRAGIPLCDLHTILQSIDTEQKGMIDFSSFLAAAMSAEPDFSDETLHNIFRNFDRELTGSITADDLKDVLGITIEDVSSDAVGMEFEEFCTVVRTPTRGLPAPLHGRLKKLKGSSAASRKGSGGLDCSAVSRTGSGGLESAAASTPEQKRSGYAASKSVSLSSPLGSWSLGATLGIGSISGRFAYQERYVVISGLKLWMFKKEDNMKDRVAQRVVDLTLNNCIVAPVEGSPSRFILRSLTGFWTGDSVTDIGEGRDFVFDTAGSEHDYQTWVDTLKRHIEFAKDEGLGRGRASTFSMEC